MSPMRKAWGCYGFGCQHIVSNESDPSVLRRRASMLPSSKSATTTLANLMAGMEPSCDVSKAQDSKGGPSRRLHRLSYAMSECHHHDGMSAYSTLRRRRTNNSSLLVASKGQQLSRTGTVCALILVEVIH